MKLTKSESGAALLEFSLITPLVVLMFIAIVDIGIAIAQGMTVEDAARAGAEYGTIAGHLSDVAGMQNAATNAANGLSGFAVTASVLYGCTPGTATTTVITSCGTYGIPIEYVKVQTSTTVPVLAGYPGIPASFALKGLAILRIQ